MTDSPEPLSELSEPPSSDEGGSPLQTVAGGANRKQSPAESRSNTDQAARDVLINKGWSGNRARSASPKQTDKADDASRRATRSATRQQATDKAKDELVKAAAPYVAKVNSSGETSNALQESAGTTQALQAIPSTKEKLATLLASVGATKGAEDILTLDPSDRLGGYCDLEAWVDGSLDLYRPEFRPLLFPIFCHFYLDLVQNGLKDTALKFFKLFSPPLMVNHASILHHLSTLLLPLHVNADTLAQRFRNDKFAIKMSKSGFSLLIGWLTEGLGGEVPGGGDGFSGEAGKRGRIAVMQVVNNHLRFDITATTSTAIKPDSWQTSSGLASLLNPGGMASTYTDAADYNAMQGPVKLGAPPIDETLQQEVERTIREQAATDPQAATTLSVDIQILKATTIPGLVEPTPSDQLPRPPSFKTIDVRREVERVRDVRKRIRLDPSHLTPSARNANSIGPQVSLARARSLPSVCAYTMHDAADSVPCSTFSMDSSLMACGFSESYIRLWNLKGDKLKGLRSDFQESTIRDTASIKRIKEKGGSTTRKLIGHSGPVFSVAFDTLAGSAATPRFLLSSSADTTVRLWSLDTMTNVVAYRGHRDPVWDVKWSPLGLYFATASRDRTARLWSTDRITPLRIFAGHLSDVDCVGFHPNSLYIATGSSDWSCRLWDSHKGNCCRVFLGHRGAITSLAISNDGRYLASAGEDLAIHLWDISSGKSIKRMTGHTGPINSMTFSAESSLLVSGGSDWTVRCWDVKGTSLKSASLNGHSNTSSTQSSGLEETGESADLLATFPTKRTPIINVQFTPRNLCMVAGAALSYDHRP